jgi:hypothetical protein
MSVSETAYSLCLTRIGDFRAAVITVFATMFAPFFFSIDAAMAWLAQISRPIHSRAQSECCYV